jgi:hypothetical protein
LPIRWAKTDNENDNESKYDGCPGMPTDSIQAMIQAE